MSPKTTGIVHFAKCFAGCSNQEKAVTLQKEKNVFHLVTCGYNFKGKGRKSSS